MGSKINRASNIAELPQSCFFPQTANALIVQAKAFIGKDIVLDPHWRASISLWLDEEGNDSYRKWLADIQKQQGRAYGAFVTASNLGAYIVYADHGPTRWDGSLSSNSGGNAEMICHEVGHLLAYPDRQNLTQLEYTYYNEQCAILASCILKTVVGNREVNHTAFPMLKQFMPSHIQESMGYDTFTLYTPCPLARYFETEIGRQDGMRRYLAATGIIRFDRIASDIIRTSQHFAQHLAVMKLFGDIANNIAMNPPFAEYVARFIPGFDRVKPFVVNKPVDDYAKAILTNWWVSVVETTTKHGQSKPMKNIYMANCDDFVSRTQVYEYYADLLAIIKQARRQKPQDPLLPILVNGLSSIVEKPPKSPRILSTVTANYVETANSHVPSAPKKSSQQQTVEQKPLSLKNASSWHRKHPIKALFATALVIGSGVTIYKNNQDLAIFLSETWPNIFGNSSKGHANNEPLLTSPLKTRDYYVTRDKTSVWKSIVDGRGHYKIMNLSRGQKIPVILAEGQNALNKTAKWTPVYLNSNCVAYVQTGSLALSLGKRPEVPSKMSENDQGTRGYANGGQSISDTIFSITHKSFEKTFVHSFRPKDIVGTHLKPPRQFIL